MNDTGIVQSPVWPNGVVIPIISVGGESDAGKSLFCGTITPGSAIAFDFSRTLVNYAKTLGIECIDMVDVLHTELGDNYSMKVAYEVFIDKAHEVPVGKYDTMIIDPITDIEEGFVDYFAATKHSHYGFETPGKFKRTKGVFWGFCRNSWKRVLLSLAARVQVLAYTKHMRSKVDEDGVPIEGEREMRGLSTLSEIASLELVLDRSHGRRIPSATVTKSKVIQWMDGECIDIVIPRKIAECTPQAIRDLITGKEVERNKEPNARMVELTEPQYDEVAKEGLGVIQLDAEHDPGYHEEPDVNEDAPEEPGDGGADQVTDEHRQVITDAASLEILPKVMDAVRKLLTDVDIEVPDVPDVTLVSLLPEKALASVRKRLDTLLKQKGNEQ